jgi:hypothetical protein
MQSMPDPNRGLYIILNEKKWSNELIFLALGGRAGLAWFHMVRGSEGPGAWTSSPGL